MTKKVFKLFLLTLTITIIFSFISCQDKSRKELILGKWKMNEKQYKPAQMALEFNKDNTSILDRIVNGQSTFKQFYTYKLIDKDQYLLLEPIDSNQKVWKVEIINLDNKKLTFRSKSLDSSSLTLERQEQ